MSTPSRLHRTCFAIALSMALVTHARAAETLNSKPDAAHTLAQKFADPTRSAQATATTQPKAKIERPSLDYEMEMLRRARTEAEDRKAIPKPTTIDSIVQEKTSIVEPAQTFSLTNQAPQAAQVTQKSTHAADSSAPKPLEANPPSPHSPIPTPILLLKSADTVSPQKTAVPAHPANATRATLLLVMDETYDTTQATPDPILCMGDTCHVSSGFERAAINIDRKDTAALTNSRAASPNSCMGHSACVFRDVLIPQDAIVEVMNLGSTRKLDSNDGYSAEVDRSCKTTDGTLICEHPLSTSTFRVWIVPEDTAKSAGAEALETAIVEGLPHMNVSRADDK